MKLNPIVMALCIFATAGAQAAQFDFSGSISTHKDVVQIGFTLADAATDVRVWTDSFQSGVNFDPITAVWSKNGDDWTRIGQNDDNASIAPGQTYFDSGLTFTSLTAGEYRFTIATFNNWANGTQLSQGFQFDQQTAIPLAQWTQPASHGNMGPNYSVHLSGVTVAAPVPEPETYAMLLAGLGLMGSIARRRKQK